MTDLVDRLRKFHGMTACWVCLEAADEIERLTAVVDAATAETNAEVMHQQAIIKAFTTPHHFRLTESDHARDTLQEARDRRRQAVTEHNQQKAER